MVFGIEGTDGSGKSEHIKRLQQWLEDQGYRVAVFDFPRYGQPSARNAERYLAGEFGPLPGEAGAKQVSRYFAEDRLAALPAIRQALADDRIVLFNRYVSSNLAHQGGKIANTVARHAFYDWANEFEYGQLGAVRPTLTFVLRMPSRQAQANVDQKADRAHLQGQRRDIHEADLQHLLNAADCYDELCRLHPEQFVPINCADEHGRMLGLPIINDHIRQRIATLLQPQKEEV